MESLLGCCLWRRLCRDENTWKILSLKKYKELTVDFLPLKSWNIIVSKIPDQIQDKRIKKKWYMFRKSISFINLLIHICLNNSLELLLVIYNNIQIFFTSLRNQTCSSIFSDVFLMHLVPDLCYGWWITLKMKVLGISVMPLNNPKDLLP